MGVQFNFDNGSSVKKARGTVTNEKTFNMFIWPFYRLWGSNVAEYYENKGINTCFTAKIIFLLKSIG